MRIALVSAMIICFISACGVNDLDSQMDQQTTQQETDDTQLEPNDQEQSDGVYKPRDCFEICGHSSCDTVCWDWKTTVCGKSELSEECTTTCKRLCGYYTPCGRSCWKYGSRMNCGQAGYDCAPDDDWDRDGVKNNVDNCKTKPNSNQKNIDCDDKGDACDNKDDYIYNDCRENVVGRDFFNTRTFCCKNRWEEFEREDVYIDWVRKCKVKRCYGSPPYNIRWEWKVVDIWTDFLISDCYNGWPCNPTNNNTKYYSCLR